MIVFPNAKINLGLHVVEKREDGFHNIETVFYPIGWSDILEVIKSQNPSSALQFKKSGLRISGGAKKNLCIKAYDLLKEQYDLPAVSMYLHKIIPIGAGLGGGSSDGCSTILLLNNLFKLQLTEEQLSGFASQLGSDCAFFLHNKPAYASAKGDQFENISLSLAGYWCVVVKPDVNVSTVAAYKSITAQSPTHNLKDLINKPIERWKELLLNDFEAPISKKNPVIQYIKEELYTAGAVYASMSGSGSAVFGIFETEIDLKKTFSAYQLWQGKLK